MQKRNLLLTTLLALSSVPGFTYATEKNKNVEKNKVQSSVLNNKNSTPPSNSFNIGHVATAFGFGALTNAISAGAGALTHKHFSDKDIDAKNKEAQDYKTKYEEALVKIGNLESELEKNKTIISDIEKLCNVKNAISDIERISTLLAYGAIFDKVSEVKYEKNGETLTGWLYCFVSDGEATGPLNALLERHKGEEGVELEKLVGGDFTKNTAIATFNAMNDDAKKDFLETAVKSMAVCSAMMRADKADESDEAFKYYHDIAIKNMDVPA